MTKMKKSCKKIVGWFRCEQKTMSSEQQQQDAAPQETLATLHATLKQQSADVYRTTNKIIQFYKQKAMEDIYADRKKMLQEQQQLEEENSKVKKAFVLPEKIELDVGGVFYQTSLSVLRSVPGSFLAVMFSGEYDLQPDAQGRYFLDRNGHFFKACYIIAILFCIVHFGLFTWWFCNVARGRREAITHWTRSQIL